MDEAHGNSGSSDNETGTGAFGVNATEQDPCPSCGRSTSRNGGLQQLLGRLGISEAMVRNLETQFQDVNLDEYLDTARMYLKDGGAKATTYARENPGKVAAGVAAVAVGAGLLIAKMKSDR